MKLANKLSQVLTIIVLCSGCASSVEVVPLTSGIYPPNKISQVEVLRTAPNRPYKEIADVSANQFPVNESERMYIELRSRAAELGADAVLITDEARFRRDFILYRSVTAIALKWETGK